MPQALEHYRDHFFRTLAEFNDQEIEWGLTTRIPSETNEVLRRTTNPEGTNLGPPRGRHGMVTSNT